MKFPTNPTSPGNGKAAPLLALVFTMALGATASAATLIDVSTQNGGFNSITGKSNFSTPTNSSNSIPYWGATLVNTSGTAVAAPNNSGAEIGGNVVQEGTAGAFFQGGGASTAFNLATSYTIQAGDQFTLTWWAYKTGANGQQSATLFSQSPATVAASWAYNPTATLATAAGATNPLYALTGTAQANYTQYTLTYTATAADVGNYIGVTIGNSGTDFIAVDNFNLSVVPEPSSLAAIAGLGGLLFIRRNRRAVC